MFFYNDKPKVVVEQPQPTTTDSVVFLCVGVFILLILASKMGFLKAMDNIHDPLIEFDESPPSQNTRSRSRQKLLQPQQQKKQKLMCGMEGKKINKNWWK